MLQYACKDSLVLSCMFKVVVMMLMRLCAAREKVCCFALANMGKLIVTLLIVTLLLLYWLLLYCYSLIRNKFNKTIKISAKEVSQAKLDVMHYTTYIDCKCRMLMFGVTTYIDTARQVKPVKPSHLETVQYYAVKNGNSYFGSPF